MAVLAMKRKDAGPIQYDFIFTFHEQFCPPSWIYWPRVLWERVFDNACALEGNRHSVRRHSPKQPVERVLKTQRNILCDRLCYLCFCRSYRSSTHSTMSLSLKTPDFSKGRGNKGKRRELGDEQKQEIKEAFDLFDTDKDRAIDYHELKVKDY